MEKSKKERVQEIKEERKNTPREYRTGGLTIGDVKIMGKITDYADLSSFGFPEKTLENITWDMFIRLVNNRLTAGPDIDDDTEITEFYEAIGFLGESSKKIQ